MPDIDAAALISALSTEDDLKALTAKDIPPPVVFTEKQLPLLKLESERFEILTLAMARTVMGWDAAYLHGPSGVGDLGIDILACTPNGEAVGLQSKCVEKFTAAALAKAVSVFDSQRPTNVARLIVMVASRCDDKKFVPKLAELKSSHPHLEIELWDGFRISAELREHPALISTAFGRYWAQAFCPGRLALTPRQLPAALTDFTGRSVQMTALSELASAAVGRTTGCSIAAIVGSGGCGKSTLATQAAHIVAADFPDGAIFVNLAGSSDAPSTPAQAITAVMRGMGETDDVLEASLEELAARLRTMLAHQRVILILDDAADEDQVRPLLPGNGPAFVMVTSRNKLLGLSDVARMDIGSLQDSEAVALLERIGGQRAAADDKHTAEVARLCGNLPLALRIAGNLIAGGLGWNASFLARQLRDERERLSELHAGDLDVRASFSLSYRRLPSRLRSLFTQLVLIPGPRFDADLAAPLCSERESSTGEREVQRQLRDLASQSLLEADAEPGWYRLHDLVRVYASELLAETTPPADADAAHNRVLGKIMGMAAMCGTAISPLLAQTHGEGGDGYDPRALRWLDTYWANVVPAIHSSVMSRHLDELAITVPRLIRYVIMRRRASDWLPAIEAAAEAARDTNLSLFIGFEEVAVEALKNLRQYEACLQRIDDLLPIVPDTATARLASIHNVRGIALQELYRHDEALAAFTQSIHYWEQSGVTTAVSSIRHNMASSLRALGQHEEAIEHYEHDLAHARQRGDDWEAAWTLNSLANAYRDADRDDDAIAALKEAEKLYRKVGDIERAGHALNDLGVTYNTLQRFDEARECISQDMEICLANGDDVGWAVAAINMCRNYAMTGDSNAAVDIGLKALATLERDGRPHQHAGIRIALAMAYLVANEPLQGLPHAQVAAQLRDVSDDGDSVDLFVVFYAHHLHEAGHLREAAAMMRLYAGDGLEELR